MLWPIEGRWENEDQNKRMACIKRGGAFHEDLSSICESEIDVLIVSTSWISWKVVRVMCGKQQNKKKDWLYRRFEVTDQETLAEAESLIETDWPPRFNVIVENL